MRCVAIAVCFLAPWRGLLASEVTVEGQQLAKAIDDMNVEKLWLAKNRVHWKSGEAYGEPPTDGKAHTHCSAFVAAFCYRHGIYILRPPEHSATMLANAQYDWLNGEGQKKGWTSVSGASEAQRLANQGMVVVAALKEDDPRKHGHIAIIRPDPKSESAIVSEGPQIAQAGMDNYNSASLKEGFKHHRGAWAGQQVRYFAHPFQVK
jgi:hypothetical protein